MSTPPSDKNIMIYGAKRAGMHNMTRQCIELDTGDTWSVQLREKNSKAKNGGDNTQGVAIYN